MRHEKTTGGEGTAHKQNVRRRWGKRKRTGILGAVCLGVLIFFVLLFLGYGKGAGPFGGLSPRQRLLHLAGETREVHRQEYTVFWGDRELKGTLYLPVDGRETREIVILSHGLNATAAYNMSYIQALSGAGIAVYAFDFYGGSHWGNSGGDTREMTVSGEMEQLSCVIDTVRSWPWVDGERVILMGESQGGLVSALVAAEREDIDSLILIYPAFSLPEMFREKYRTPEQVPDTFSFSGMTLGKEYCMDLWELDPYQELKNFAGPVLLIHGDRDPVIPLASSRRAQEAFPNARLEVIRGVGHGFEGEALLAAARKSFAFVRER